MKILVINGPNLNMLGIREKGLYGEQDYNYLINLIKIHASNKKIDVDFYQSNHEGDLVDKIQEAYFKKFDGIIINPGAYTHTSIALLDALKAVSIPYIEVHITNIDERESFRKISYIRENALTSFIGFGLQCYIMALDYLEEYCGRHN